MKKILVIFFVLFAFSGNTQELRNVLTEALEYFNSGNCKEAAPLFDEMLSSNLSAIKNNPSLEYTLNYYAGYCAKEANNFTKSEAHFVKALKIAEKNKYYAQLSVLKAFLGESLRELGEYKKAIKYYEEALRDLPENSLEAGSILYFIAEAQRGIENYSASIENCTKAITIANLNKNARLELACLTSIGESYNEIEDYPNAIEKFTRALQSARLSQMPLEMANNHRGLALVYEKMGKHSLAKQNYDEALRLYVASLNTKNIPTIVDRLVSLPSSNPSDSIKSVKMYVQHLDALMEETNSEILLNMFMLIGHTYKNAENYIQALAAFDEVLELAMKNSYYQEVTKVTLLMSDLYYLLEDYTNSMFVLAKAEEYLSTSKSPDLLALINAKKGWLNYCMGKKDLAITFYKKASKETSNKESRKQYQDEALKIEKEVEQELRLNK